MQSIVDRDSSFSKFGNYGTSSIFVKGKGLTNRVFHICTEMPILAFSFLLCENKKEILVIKCYP